VESSLGRLNELEVEDIEKGVDDLVGRGLVDAAKLGVMGWSQGGVLTAALTVKTNRYQAAVAGDGVIDWIDYWAKSDVTRAQFAQFEERYRIEPGQENFPASGISFEQAKGCCAWLSKLTGDIYRLPSQSEAESLYADSSLSENTLDYWAGGPVNPDDADRIKTQTCSLGGPAPLLKAVGSFKGSGTAEPVFDNTALNG
jgi:hypothetical protein